MSILESLHILVIEDDPDTRANLRDILELDDHRVEAAGSAAEALARCRGAAPSAILLDRKLPDATAEELLPRLRRAAPDAAVIVVTGFADLQGAVSALRQGATDYILKPIDADDLRARLRRIAERQRAESELRRQAEIIRSLLESASDAIIVADHLGNVVLCNPAAERLIGPMRVGAPPVEEAPTGGAMPRLPLTRALRREPVIDEEVPIRRAGADPDRWLSVNASPICDGDEIKGAVVIYRDITERKRAEAELRRQRDLAEGLIDAAPALVVVLDPEGRIVRFNRFAEELSGYRADEVMSWDFFATLLPGHDAARVREAFRGTRDALESGGTAGAIVTRDGRRREVRWSHRVLKDAEARVVGVLAIGQDVTDLSEAQERALRAERLAAIGEVVAGLAHESRNALQRSQACLEMLALHVQDRPEGLGLIARLQRAQDQLHHLYEDVRGYAAPIRLERRACDLSAIWRDAWAHLQPQRAGRSAALREHCDGSQPICLADPFRIEQVFHNILENALAACPDPLEITVCCTRAEIDGRPAQRVAFRDNGPGIAPADHERIFEPFFTTKTKGTGLGLPIARRIVEAHGGRLAAGEGSGVGAEIVVTLPRGEP
jgi:PAS domain S-box-containing protein